MLFKFTRHKLEETENGYNVTLYMDNILNEFSNEFNNDKAPKGNDILNKSVMEYIKSHLPNIKINIIKVMIGSVLVLTISMTALQASLEIVEAAPGYSEDQIQKALDTAEANIVFDREILELPQKPFIIQGITYVPIREVCDKLGFEVNWNNEHYINVRKEDTNLNFKIGASQYLLNGKTNTMPKTMIVNDKTMVPLRFMSEIFGFHVSWNDGLKTVIISSTGDMPTQTELETIVSKFQKPQNKLQQPLNYKQEDIYWLSRIVNAEANGESYQGKLAVANCILNRVKNDDFPTTIKEVIFDTKYAVQYQPTSNGEIYKEPSNESIQAAIAALNGNDNSKGSLYFLNPQKATSTWITKNKQYAFNIGNHDFYF